MLELFFLRFNAPVLACFALRNDLTLISAHAAEICIGFIWATTVAYLFNLGPFAE